LMKEKATRHVCVTESGKIVGLISVSDILRFYPFNAFRSLLGIAGNVAAPTYAGLYSGEWSHPSCYV